MSTMEICQIDEYVKAIEAEDGGACPNSALHTVGLTIGTLTFFYKLCPGCHALVLNAAKVQEATQRMVYQSNRTDNDTYEKLLNKLRQKMGC